MGKKHRFHLRRHQFTSVFMHVDISFFACWHQFSCVTFMCPIHTNVDFMSVFLHAENCTHVADSCTGHIENAENACRKTDVSDLWCKRGLRHQSVTFFFTWSKATKTIRIHSICPNMTVYQFSAKLHPLHPATLDVCQDKIGRITRTVPLPLPTDPLWEEVEMWVSLTAIHQCKSH